MPPPFDVRMHILKDTIVPAMSLLFLLPGTRTSEANDSGSDQPPHIILVLTDDQGIGDLSAHGNPHLATPCIDSIASEGISLTRFYVSPVCAPTRASLMTGRYAYRTGVAHTSRGGALMKGEETTLAEVLVDCGYRTGIFGKWHLGDNFPMRPQDQGFQRSLTHQSGGIGQAPDRDNQYQDPLLYSDGVPARQSGYCTDLFFDAAIDFLLEKSEQPAFIYLPTNTPHSPFQVDERYSQPFLDRGLDETTAKIYGMIVNLDQNLARLDRALEQSGMRHNTLLIFMTDNGANGARFNAGLRGHKASVYEGGIRVPCFMRWPDRIAAGTRLTRPAAHIDMLPTLAKVALAHKTTSSVTSPQPQKAAPIQRPVRDGINLLPSLLGESQHLERDLFIQCHRGTAPVKGQNVAVIADRWKLLINPGTFGDWDFSGPNSDIAELYDLESDPGESRDLASMHPETVSAIQKRYETWFDEVSAGFEPGRIEFGPDAPPDQRLCVYQDSQWTRGEAPTGWLIDVSRSGTYEISMEEFADGKNIEVLINGRVIPAEQVAPGTLKFHLDAGIAKLHLQTVADGETGQPTPVLEDARIRARPAE